MERWKREVVMVDPKQLIPHPRRGEGGPRYDSDEGMKNLPMNMVALQADILENGIELPLLVQEETNILIAGHFRRMVALEVGWAEIPVYYLQVTDREAYEMMMQDNFKRNDKMAQDRMAISRNVGLLVHRHDIPVEGISVHSRDTNTGNNGSPSTDKGGYSVSGKESISALVRKHFNISRRAMYDYLSLLNLVPELQALSSEDRIGFRASVKVSKLDPEVQMEFYKRFGNEDRITDNMVSLFLTQWEVAVASANSLVRVEVNEQAKAHEAVKKKPGSKSSSKDVATEQTTAQLTIPLDALESNVPVAPKTLDEILKEDPGKKEQIKQTALEHLDDLDSMKQMNVVRFNNVIQRNLQIVQRMFTDINQAWTNEVMDYYGQPGETPFEENNEVRQLRAQAHQIADLMDAIASMKHYVPDETEAKG